jgi:hypothetical protein
MLGLKRSDGVWDPYRGLKRLGETEAWAGYDAPLRCLKAASCGVPRGSLLEVRGKTEPPSSDEAS